MVSEAQAVDFVKGCVVPETQTVHFDDCDMARRDSDSGFVYCCMVLEAQINEFGDWCMVQSPGQCILMTVTWSEEPQTVDLVDSCTVTKTQKVNLTTVAGLQRLKQWIC